MQREYFPGDPSPQHNLPENHANADAFTNTSTDAKSVIATPRYSS
jgi:hypothetical protein